MQSEHFDNKIREAADHHHPAYDEKAWEKMEKLLDKHLPQKKDDRRRIIFFLLLFVLLGGGAWFFFGGAGHSNKTITKNDQNNHSNSIVSNSDDKQSNISIEKNSTAVTPHTKDIKGSNEENLLQTEKSDKTIAVFNRKKYDQSVLSIVNDRLRKTVRSNSTSLEKIKPENKQEPIEKHNTVDQANLQTNTMTTDEVNNKTSNTDKINDSKAEGVEKNKSDLLANSNISTTKTATETTEVNKAVNEEKKDVASKSNTNSSSKESAAKSKKGNYFFLSLSAGPDVSAAGINNIGKVKPVYGIGVGFSFHDKFSLKTGFYSSRKIYNASPYEYHPAYNIWNYYPYLNEVDADCRVFEIPVMVSYNFVQSKSHSIFGTAGISSYFMKRETYNYISKLPSGQITSNERTYNNRNKHYFSVITLSAGYVRKLNKSVSLAAEPYVKVPVEGIGFGKMQLNSAGVLFSVIVKPFKEIKKK